MCNLRIKKEMRLYSPVNFTMGEALSREDEVMRNLAFLMNDIIKIKSLENLKKKKMHRLLDSQRV